MGALTQLAWVGQLRATYSEDDSPSQTRDVATSVAVHGMKRKENKRMGWGEDKRRVDNL